ncbi:hypothetical protein Tco_1311745, partial [Tanacetum coccineum]
EGMDVERNKEGKSDFKRRFEETLEVDIIDNKRGEIAEFIGDMGIFLDYCGSPKSIKNFNSKAKNNEDGLANSKQSFRFWNFCDDTYGQSFNGRKKDFNAGLKNEGNQQIKQLTGLRRKYLVKMLMTNINEKVSQVEEEAKKFNEYNDNQEKCFEKYALQRLQSRVSKYYNKNEEKLREAWNFLPKFNVTNNMM